LGIDLNIVIVTYNNKDLLKKCIESVNKSIENVALSSNVTVVDNASNDGTEDLIKSIPNVKYIKNKSNIGLAKALNIGIKSNLDSRYTLLLNDDVELFPETINLMIEMLEKYSSAYGIPARLIYPDGAPQRMKLKIIGVSKSIKQNISFINFAGTTACLYKTSIFNKIGLFDEFYFFYNEDLDFSLRAKRNGINFVFNPEIKVIHHKKKGRKKVEKEIKPYFYATDFYFYRKNYGILFAGIYLLMAFWHIKRSEKNFKRNNQEDKLLMLYRAKERLKSTIKNFKNLVKQ